MVDKIIRSINCQEEFLKSLEKFKDVFIRYYGEKYGEHIEEMFNNNIFIAYQTPEALEISIHELEKAKTNELISDVFNGIDINITLEDITNNYSFLYRNIHPIYKYIDFYKLATMSFDEQKQLFINKGYNSLKDIVPDFTLEEYKEMYQTKIIPEKLKKVPLFVKNNIEYFLDDNNINKELEYAYNKTEKLLNTIHPDISIDNYKEYLASEEIQKLNIVAKRYLEKEKEYDIFMEQFKDVYLEIQDNKKRKLNCQTKYFKEFIRKTIDLIPISQREKIEQYINDEKSEYLSDQYGSFIYGNSLLSITGLDAFTEQKERALYDSKTITWEKDEIKKRRIKFFNINGIDLGDDYENYLNNQEVQRIWPSTEKIENFFKLRAYYINKYNNDYYEGMISHKRLREKIESYDILDKEDSVNAKMYTEKTTCVNPNITHKNGFYELLPLIIINFDNYDAETRDHYIIHELNHLFELHLENIIGNEYDVLCGWDNLSGKINQEKVEETDTINEHNNRKYELFNEIINELIAQDISKMMHKENIYIFDDENHSKIKNTTSYEHSLFLVSDFFNEFKDKIIESRHGGNIEIIYNEVGKENFDELNDLFEIFFENFSGFKIYNLLSSLKNNEYNELTKVYYELVDKRDKILEKMHEHSKKNKIETEMK